MTLSSIYHVYLAKLRGYKIDGSPRMKQGAVIVIDRSSSISFGSGVELRKDSEIRAKNGSILNIGDSTVIDNGARVIANNSLVDIGKGCKIGFHTVINGGGGVFIGDDTKFYGFCYVQSSTHILDNSGNDTGEHSYDQVTVGSRVMIYANAVIKPGTTIQDNQIINWNEVYK